MSTPSNIGRGDSVLILAGDVASLTRRVTCTMYEQLIAFCDGCKDLPAGVLNLPDTSHLPDSRVYLIVKARVRQGHAYAVCDQWQAAERSVLAALHTIFMTLTVDQGFDETLVEVACNHLENLYISWVSGLTD